MKAISLWQPWASLMANGSKLIETRSWPTEHRGLIAIHAAKHVERSVLLDPVFEQRLCDATLPTGCIVAVVDIYDCRGVEWICHGHEGFSELERDFGDYTPGRGRYGFLTRNLRKLKNPVVCRGFQKIWNLPIEIECRVIEQL